MEESWRSRISKPSEEKEVKEDLVEEREGLGESIPTFPSIGLHTAETNNTCTPQPNMTIHTDFT